MGRPPQTPEAGRHPKHAPLRSIDGAPASVPLGCVCVRPKPTPRAKLQARLHLAADSCVSCLLAGERRLALAGGAKQRTCVHWTLNHAPKAFDRPSAPFIGLAYFSLTHAASSTIHRRQRAPAAACWLGSQASSNLQKRRKSYRAWTSHGRRSRSGRGRRGQRAPDAAGPDVWKDGGGVPAPGRFVVWYRFLCAGAGRLLASRG